MGSGILVRLGGSGKLKGSVVLEVRKKKRVVGVLQKKVNGGSVPR